MKTIFYRSFLLLITVTLFGSCSFDNYDEPNVKLSGRLLDGTETLNTKRGIAFKLFQYREDGFISAGSTWINVYTDQEGKFSSVLFPGRYKMVVNTNNGGTEDPDIYSSYTWGDFPKDENTGELDTLYFTLSGNKTMEFQVKPYYKFKDVETVYRNDSLILSFSITKLLESTDASMNIQVLKAFLSPTMHINNTTEVAFNMSARQLVDLRKLGVGDTSDKLEIKCYLKDYYSNQYYVNNYRDYAYVRLGAATKVNPTVFNYSSIVKATGMPEETIKKFK